MLFVLVLQNVSREGRISRGNLWPAGVTFISLSTLYLGRYRDKHQKDQKKNLQSMFFPYLSKKYVDGCSFSLISYWYTFSYLVNLLSCQWGPLSFYVPQSHSLTEQLIFDRTSKTRWSNLFKQERVVSDCLWSCPVGLLLMGVFKAGISAAFLNNFLNGWLTLLWGREEVSQHLIRISSAATSVSSLIPGSCRLEMTLPPLLLNLPIRPLNTEKPCPPPPKTEGAHALSLSMSWICFSTLTTLESLHQIPSSTCVTGIG